MINPQWLELPMSRANFHGPKDVRAIEVRLYNIGITYSCVTLHTDKDTSRKENDRRRIIYDTSKISDEIGRMHWVGGAS